MTGKAVCLTIDNGPEPEVTPKILDILARRGVAVTFFLVGARAAVDEGRALAERAAAEGHRIGNHCWSHSRPLGEMTPDESVGEIARTQAAIDDLAGPDRLFRPVGGGGQIGPHLLTRAAHDHLVEGGYSCVLWNCVPGDFSGDRNWVERAMADCERLEAPLVVLHDLPGACIGRLDEFLGAMADRGFAFTQDIPEAEIVIDRGVPGPRATEIVAGGGA